MRFITALAALVASAPVALAGPQAYVKNNCPYDVYLWAIDILRRDTPVVVIKPGGEYSEPYHSLPSGGVSLKITKDGTLNYPLQFEYTLAGGFIWYDGSHVDCRGTQCPFYADGVHLEASDPSCPQRTCKPNADCTGFYINWNDDWNTLACNPSASVNMYLCSQTAAGGSAPAAAAPAAASSAPEASASVEPKKVQMEAIHGLPATIKLTPSSVPVAKRHIHNHMRRHSHQ